jgi:hypothetical protein
MVARRTPQFVTLKHTFRIVLQERIHEFSALLTFIGIQSFSFRFLANDFLVAKGGRIIHRGYCICCCAAGLVVVLLLLWETTGLRFTSGGLGVCLRGGAVVTAVGVGLVVVAPPGCPTKSRTKRLEIQPCCSALLVLVLVLLFDSLERRSLLEEAGRLGVIVGGYCWRLLMTVIVGGYCWRLLLAVIVGGCSRWRL